MELVGSPDGVRYRAHYTNLRVLETDPRVMDTNLRGLDTVMVTNIINIGTPLFDRSNKMFLGKTHWQRE